MSNHSNGFKWCMTWKSLLHTSIVISTVFVALHIVELLVWYSLIDKVVHQIISAVIICHIAFIAFFVCYIKNYNYLMSIQAMEKSSKRFWHGLLPIILGELVNITALICFLVET